MLTVHEFKYTCLLSTKDVVVGKGEENSIVYLTSDTCVHAHNGVMPSVVGGMAWMINNG